MLSSKEGKLVETIEQPMVEVHYTPEEVDLLLAESEKRRDIKAMEFAGAEQEVARFQAMKDKCVEFGITKKDKEVVL